MIDWQSIDNKETEAGGQSLVDVPNDDRKNTTKLYAMMP